MSSTDTAIRIERVTDKKGLNTFIDLTRPLYADDPNWVPPLKFERMGVLDKEKNPYFEHAKAEYWIAYKHGKPVGRISAQVDDLAQETQGKGTGHFGLIEGADDPAVFKALFETAENWLREQGMSRALGPFNLSVNEECGLLTKGFDTPPMIMMGHALPYYAARVEEQGYSGAKKLYAYDLDVMQEFPERTQRILRKGKENDRLRIRTIDKKNLKADLEVFIDIFNDAWADNWGFVRFTPNEIAKMADDLGLFLKPEICNIAYWDGEPCAFMITLPNINEVIKKMDGKLFPFGWVYLLKDLIIGTPKTGRVPLMGVKKEHQSRVSGALMSLSLIEECRSRGVNELGFERGELSWILEDNHAMRDMLTSIGCAEYKEYMVYEKTL